MDHIKAAKEAFSTGYRPTVPLSKADEAALQAEGYYLHPSCGEWFRTGYGRVMGGWGAVGGHGNGYGPVYR